MGGISYVIHILRSLTKSDFFGKSMRSENRAETVKIGNFNVLRKKWGKVRLIFS